MTPPLKNTKSLRTRCLARFLFQTCLLAYVLADWLPAGRTSVLVLGVAALSNLVLYAAVRWGPAVFAPVVHRLAPGLGLATWGVLTGLEGGVGGSLFMVGFSFEIVLSAVGHSVAGVVGITLGSVVVLWLQQIPLGFGRALAPLVLHTSILGIVGGTTAWIRRSWQRRQQSFTNLLDEQERRLSEIEEKLADTRALADLGARTARLGHGLKNAVHSLRGFSTLIERGLDVSAAEHAALRGLKDSIDQLEALALESLRPDEAPRAAASEAHPDVPAPGLNGTPAESAESDLREILDALVTDVTHSFPRVRCRVLWQAEKPPRVPRRVVSEVLSNLLVNAAESMGHEGEVTVRVARGERGCEIQVTDQGPGVSPDMESRLFRPGHSTKSNGHGMGLYLAKSLMESQGGSLSLASSETGASFRVALPASWA